MTHSRCVFIAGMLAALPVTTRAQPQPSVRARNAPIACALAARSLRDWGWGSRIPDPAATPLASIVAAVNYQLRANAGKLGPKDALRLTEAVASGNPCVRELSLAVLATQEDGGRSKGPAVRVAQSERGKTKIRD